MQIEIEQHTEHMKKLIFTLLFTLTITVTSFAQGFFEHTVVAGESVASIVQKYEVSPYEIYELNPDAKNGIKVGSVLVFLKNRNYPFDANFVAIKKHKTLKGETLYSISKLYDIDVSTLKKFNPKLYSETLSRKCKLKIPIFKKSPADEVNNDVLEVSVIETTSVSINHQVLEEETLYGISKKYGISISDLESANLNIKEGLKVGQILKISQQKNTATIIETATDTIVNNQYAIYQVKAKEGFYRLTKKLSASKDLLIALNPQLVEGIKVGMLLKYPIGNLNFSDKPSYDLTDSIVNFKKQYITLVLPLRLHKVRANDSTFNLKKLIKKEKLMNLALDFYSGSQMAIDSVRKLGIDVRFNVIDTEYDTDKVANKKRMEEIANTDFEDDEIIIGPLMAGNVTKLALGLSDENVTILAPYPVRKGYKPANLLQTAVPEYQQRQKMTLFLEKYAKDKQVIIVSDSTAMSVKNSLLLKFPNAKVIMARKGGLLIPKDFNGILKNDKENVVIIETKKAGLVATVISILEAKLIKYNITMATTSSKKQFDKSTIDNRYKTKLNFHFPSIEKTKTFKRDNSFMKLYKETYGQAPNKYAMRGFDLTLDAVLRRANKVAVDAMFSEIGETSYLENKFNYVKNLSGGYTNDAVYILRYTADFRIEEVKEDEPVIEIIKKKPILEFKED